MARAKFSKFFFWIQFLVYELYRFGLVRAEFLFETILRICPSDTVSDASRSTKQCDVRGTKRVALPGICDKKDFTSSRLS